MYLMLRQLSPSVVGYSSMDLALEVGVLRRPRRIQTRHRSRVVYFNYIWESMQMSMRSHLHSEFRGNVVMGLSDLKSQVDCWHALLAPLKIEPGLAGCSNVGEKL